jgi:hypothetical protein
MQVASRKMMSGKFNDAGFALNDVVCNHENERRIWNSTPVGSGELGSSDANLRLHAQRNKKRLLARIDNLQTVWIWKNIKSQGINQVSIPIKKYFVSFVSCFGNHAPLGEVARVLAHSANCVISRSWRWETNKKTEKKIKKQGIGKIASEQGNDDLMRWLLSTCTALTAIINIPENSTRQPIMSISVISPTSPWPYWRWGGESHAWIFLKIPNAIALS